jgi:hypothetical protein
VKKNPVVEKKAKVIIVLMSDVVREYQVVIEGEPIFLAMTSCTYSYPGSNNHAWFDGPMFRAGLLLKPALLQIST